MVIAVVIASIAFAKDSAQSDATWRRAGHWLLRTALVVQAAGIAMLVYQVKSITNVLGQIDPRQYEKFAVWMLQQESVPQAQIPIG